MKKTLILVILFIFLWLIFKLQAAVGDKSLEYILNRVWNKTNNTLKVILK